MASNMPTTITLPPFRGVVRRIIIIALVTLFAMLVLSATPLYPTIIGSLALWPQHVLHQPWQLLTYAFLPGGILSALFSLLSLWVFGSALEGERGPRWFSEYFLVSVIGAALCVTLLSHVSPLHLNSDQYVVGLWPFTIALMLAYARFHPDEPLRFNFILTLKAKYLAAIYVLLYLALSLSGGDRLGAATAVCAALSGYAYLQFTPRRGLSFAVSEQWFALRNAYYRAKRRRAARKFTVYMKKQGKDVSLDSAGRYTKLEDERRSKDPNDKRWMN